MLGIGFFELLFILILALIFIGPEKLPELAGRLGKIIAEIKNEADKLDESIHQKPDD